MSARANPHPNARSESFIGTLKGEMLQDGCFIDERDARTEIFDATTTLTANTPRPAT